MDRENNQNMKPFLMFICSLLPGCAHMYLGLMHRGLQLLIAFCLTFAFSVTFYGLEFITIPAMVVLFVYSFFDGYSIYRNLKAGKVVADESVIEGLDSLKKIFASGYWIGLALIVFGVIIAFQNILRMDTFNSIAYYYNNYIGRFIPAILLFALGIFLMIKGNSQRKKNRDSKKHLSE